MPVQRSLYQPGKACYVTFLDGPKLWIQTFPNAVQANEVKLGLLPGRVVWKFNFPFYIRTAPKPIATAFRVLDFVLDALDDCPSRALAEQWLATHVEPHLSAWAADFAVLASALALNELGEGVFRHGLRELPIGDPEAHARAARTDW